MEESKLTALEATLFRIARKDLEASSILFREKLYSQAVFFLQQSVEKATKVVGPKEGIIKASQLKNKIGHKAWRVFTEICLIGENYYQKLDKYVESYGDVEKLAVLREIRMQLREILNYLEEGVKSLNYYKKNEALQTSDEMLNKAIDFLEYNFAWISQQVEELLNELIEKLSDKNGVEKVYEFGKLLSKFYVGKNNLGSKMEKVGMMLGLFILSYLLELHATQSRYPRDGFNPLEYYNEKTLLINRYDKIVGIAEKILEKVQQIYGLK